MAECYLAKDCLTFYSKYLHDGVKTRLDRRKTHYVSSEINSIRDEPLFFPKVGHRIRRTKTLKGKALLLDQESLKQAHKYIFFNCGCEQVEKYIEYVHLVNSFIIYFYLLYIYIFDIFLEN